MAKLAPHVVIDDFLSAELHDALLDHALRHESSFTPSAVQRDGRGYHGEGRQSWVCAAGFGELKAPLRAAVRDIAPAVCAGLGMKPFEPDQIELDLTAHRDGDFFRPHIDTFQGKELAHHTTHRVVTAVYYFHALPRAFAGGEFAVYPFDQGEPVLIEPKDNRLLAIPAFALHEVRPISCPNADFGSARFAINIWLHRARPPKAQ